MSPGLTLTQQPPISPDITIRADNTPARLWREIAMQPEFQDALVEATGQLLDGLNHDARRERALSELGVTAMNGLYAAMLPSLARSDEHYWNALTATTMFGSAGRTSSGDHADLTQIATGPLAVLAASDVELTVVVEIGDPFGDLRAEYRETICEHLLSAFANACDVSVVARRATAAKFAQRYHEVLPGVSAPSNAPRTDRDVTAAVEQAHAELDPDGREVNLLRSIVSASGESRTYSEIYGGATASKSRVRQCLSRLDRLDLVSTFDGMGGRSVEALAPAPEFVSDLDATVGRQIALGERVSDRGQAVSDSRENAPACTQAPPRPVVGENRHRLPSHHQVRQLPRWHAAATAGVAVDSGISLVDHPWEEAKDRGEPGFYYDDDAQRVIVSAEYDSPMQYWVCIARALASTWTFRHVLPPESFDGDDVETRLTELFTEHRWLLRDARCIGYLKGAATGEEFVDSLRQAEGHLCELTKRWKNGDYPCSPGEYRGLITREAHGLAGTLAHLLDLADIDLVREIRAPRYRSFTGANKRDLAKTLAVGTSIQSTYREFAANRQLFEQREDKRETAIEPIVDADDALGELIGSVVVSGPGVGSESDDLADCLRRAIDNRETHEDAPEFAVHIPIDDAVGERRSAYAQTVRRMCVLKDLSATRLAVSRCHAFAGTPYDAAAALHNLARETKVPGSSIKLHEVRFALSTLDAGRILPDETPTVQKMLKTLFATDVGESLTPEEIKAFGGPSPRSIRRHAERLEAFGFLERTDGGWRLRSESSTIRNPRMARIALEEGGHTQNLDTGISMRWPTTRPIERLADHLEAHSETRSGPLARALWRVIGPPDPEDPVDTGEPPAIADPQDGTLGAPPSQQPVVGVSGVAD